MQRIGRILSLYSSEKEYPHPIKKEKLSVDMQGIIYDKHYNKDPERSILVSSLESYRMAKEKLGVQMPEGYLGENLLIDFNPYRLPPGTQLHIGTVILEITQYCTLCKHLSKLDNRIPKLLKNDRGIFAKVIQPGEIKIEDALYLQ